MAYIAIDIGHGEDTFPPSKGVYKNGKGYAEHAFNSKLGIELRKVLESNGHKIIFGQEPYKRDVALITRTNLYNKEKVDLVVSLHANYSSNKSANGRCVFYWGTSGESLRLAQSVRDEIGALGYSLHGNGLHAGVRGSWTNFHINRETRMPAILVEHGFMSGSSDFDLIFGSKQKQYIKDMAQANAKGIASWLGESIKDKPATVKPSLAKSDAKLSFEEVVAKTIAGGYGSQPERSRNIINRTEFTYTEVQNAVNKQLLGKTPVPKRLSFAEVVKRTANGDYGNMPKRKQLVEATGHDCQQVQNAVNKQSGISSKPVATSTPKVSVGRTIRTRRLYATSSSDKNVRTSSISGYVDRINPQWKNEIRLRNVKGGYYIGFTRSRDIE